MTIRDRIQAALARYPEADRIPTLRRMVELYRERTRTAADPEHSEANRATLAAAMGMLNELRPQEVAGVRSIMLAEVDRLRGLVAKRMASKSIASCTYMPESRVWARFVAYLSELYPADIVMEAGVHFEASSIMDLQLAAVN